jgi:hypothetical protein
MATIMNKRKVLGVEEKVQVVKKIESGRKEADMCREFGNNLEKKMFANLKRT